jgi:hypothetical protein
MILPFLFLHCVVCLVLFCDVLPCLVLWCVVLPYLVVCCLVLPCVVLSCSCLCSYMNVQKDRKIKIQTVAYKQRQKQTTTYIDTHTNRQTPLYGCARYTSSVPHQFLSWACLARLSSSLTYCCFSSPSIRIMYSFSSQDTSNGRKRFT